MLKSQKKIRVLNVLTCIEDGGQEMIIYRIYKGLDKDKYDLNICTLTELKDNFITNNFKNICSNLYSLSFKNKNVTVFDYPGLVFQLFRLFNIIRKGNFDVVHSHEFFAALFTRLAVLLCKLTFHKKPSRVYITYHNIYFWLKPIHHFINKLLSYITDKIICVSGSVKNEALKKEKIKEEKFIIIYNGLDSEEFFPDMDAREYQRNILGYREDDFVICNVGVYSVRKGQIYLLKAFNTLVTKFPNIKLALVGSARDYEMDIYDEMVNFVKENDLVEKVKFVGTINEVNRIYNMLDLFVMCSVTEGFGLAAYEAMLVEKLCIFSDIAPFKELIQDGVNGFLFESKNPESLTTVLENVLSNFDKFDEVRKYGREYVKSKLSEKKMVRNYNELYFNI